MQRYVYWAQVMWQALPNDVTITRETEISNILLMRGMSNSYEDDSEMTFSKNSDLLSIFHLLEQPLDFYELDVLPATQPNVKSQMLSLVKQYRHSK